MDDVNESSSESNIVVKGISTTTQAQKYLFIIMQGDRDLEGGAVVDIHFIIYGIKDYVSSVSSYVYNKPFIIENKEIKRILNLDLNKNAIYSGSTKLIEFAPHDKMLRLFNKLRIGDMVYLVGDLNIGNDAIFSGLTKLVHFSNNAFFFYKK